MGQSRQSTGWVLLTLVICGTLAPALSAAAEDEARKFNVKPNHIKKQKAHPELFGEELKQVKDKTTVEKKEGFQWGNILGVVFKLLVGGPTDGANDKMDTITQLTNGEFSWSKLISLGVQLVLGFLGNDNAALDKMDTGSPIEGILTALISYMTGSNNPGEVNVMAKQASELINLVVSLLDALRTSFTQRSMEARYLGYSDHLSDAAVAFTSMAKGFMKTYTTDDDLCMQKFVCQSSHDCVRGTSDTGYLFCQAGTYLTAMLLERSTYTPFEIYNQAGIAGRTDDNCVEVFAECNEV